MDSSLLATITALSIAIITGFFTYITTLSVKETEVKIKLYEGLGLDSHAEIERLENNTEYLLQYLQNIKGLNRALMSQANLSYPINVDKIRELRVRILFFNKPLFYKFDQVVNFHGALIPEILGRTKVDGKPPINPITLYTEDEKEKYIDQLKECLIMANELKEEIISTTSKQYSKYTSASSKIKLTFYLFVLFVLFVISLLTYLQPTKTDDSKQSNVIINIT